MWSPVLHSCSSTELMAAMPAARHSQACVSREPSSERAWSVAHIWRLPGLRCSPVRTRAAGVASLHAFQGGQLLPKIAHSGVEGPPVQVASPCINSADIAGTLADAAASAAYTQARAAMQGAAATHTEEGNIPLSGFLAPSKIAPSVSARITACAGLGLSSGMTARDVQ